MLIQTFYKNISNIPRLYKEIVCNKCNRTIICEPTHLADTTCNLCNRCSDIKQIHVCDKNCETTKTCLSCKKQILIKNFPLTFRRANKQTHISTCRECKKTKGLNQAQNYRNKNQNHDCEINNCTKKIKYCPVCTKTLNIVYFQLNKSSATGHTSICSFCVYKKCSTEREINWNLSDEDVFKMFLQNCYYCNLKDKNRPNGIDRYDNSCGYIPENCVACCTVCNILKGSLHGDKFIQKIIEISNNIKILQALSS